ncbi:MAG: hypothetical protein OEW87_13085 [Flavobacteriaceae bacterium]|nr:hypothetical protein [Flavobacteriaceae bacterium]
MACKTFLSTILWIFIAGSLGVLVPGYAFFTSYPPPLFPEISIVISALSILIIIAAFRYKPKQIAETYGLPLFVKIAIILIVAALVILVFYVIFLQNWTVLDPQSSEVRFQIGFGKCSCGLTEAGLMLKEKFPNETVRDWMLREAAFRSNGPNIIWKSCAINAAGIILILIYLLGFILWTSGFSLLARHESIKSHSTTGQ